MTRKLTISDVSWQLACEPEDTPIKGNCMASGDDAVDRKQEEWVKRQLRNGNEWAWCYVKLTGRYKGLSAWDGLGCCSYLSESDFRKPGGYFDDMQAEVLAILQEELDSLADDLAA